MRIPEGLELPRVLTVRAARELGLTRAAVRNAAARHRWQILTRGVVLTVPGEPARADWALAGLAVAGPGSAVSGWDALALMGGRIASREPPVPHVLILTTRGRCRHAGLAHIRATRRPYRVHETSVHDPRLPLVPVVDAARAIADTALTHRWLPPVRAMVAGAIQHGTCTVDDLIGELDHCPRNGSALLRRAIADLVSGARSHPEAEAARYLRRATVPPFELNVPIVASSGRVIHVVDILWRTLRAALEIDSREFHFAERDWKATMRRHNRLMRAGLAIAHYPPSEIGPFWVRDVEQWLRSRAAELGVAYRPGARVLPTGEPLVFPDAA